MNSMKYIDKKYDLIVAGGGFTGVAAALSAVRHGLSVLFFDKSNALGGAASNALVQPFMRFFAEKDNEVYNLCAGIFEEIGAELKKANAFVTKGNDTFFDDEYLKLILNRMVAAADVDILFHAYLTDVNTDGDHIESLVLMCGERAGL